MAATYEDLAEVIDRVAKQVARDYPDIDWEDVRQELALFVIKNGKSIKLKDDGGNPRWILDRVAKDYCKKSRTEHMALSPQYAYRPSDVSLILETAFLDRDNIGFVPDDARDPLSKTFNLFDKDKNFTGAAMVMEREHVTEEDDSLPDPREREVVVLHPDPFHEIDYMDVSSDVRAAARLLKPELKEAIFNRYVLGIVPHNNSYERKKLNKAVNELTRKLNWYRGHSNNNRRAVTNAGARAIISEVYEGRNGAYS